MKYFLTLFFIFTISAAFGQDGYYLTKAQHEQIKKNLKDYRTLIYNFDEQKKKFDELKSQFEFLRKLHSDQSLELQKLKTDNIDIHNLEVKVSNLEEQKRELNERIQSMQRDLDIKNKSLITYKKKYHREYTANRGDRIAIASIWGTMAVCAVWGIYTSIEANH